MAWDSHKTEQAIGNLLRAGVLTAAVIVLAGGLLYLSQYHRDTIHYSQFRGEPQELKSIAGIVRGAVHLDSRALIQFGLLLLILTPILRVIFAAIAFGLERDRMYVVVSLIVLGVLLFSLLHAT